MQNLSTVTFPQDLLSLGRLRHFYSPLRLSPKRKKKKKKKRALASCLAAANALGLLGPAASPLPSLGSGLMPSFARGHWPRRRGAAPCSSLQLFGEAAGHVLP